MKDLLKKYVLRHVFKILFAVLVVGLFIYIMLPFILPIVLGGILAMAITPTVNKLVARGLTPGTSLLVTIVGLGIVGLAPAVVFFVRGSRKITELMEHADFTQLSLRLKGSAYGVIDKLSSLYGLDEKFAQEKMDTVFVSLGAFVSSTLSDFVTAIPDMIMLSFITLLSVYVFLRESKTIRQLFDRYFYFSKSNGDRFIDVLAVSCREVFVTNILTGIIQSLFVATSAALLGVGDFFLLFFVTFVCSFMPVLGAGPVAAVLALYCFFESQTIPGIVLLVVAGVAGVADNVVRPFLASRGEVAVHPFVGLLAVIGGVVMFGLPGLFIGPLIASLCFGVLPIIVEEYFPPNTDDGADT